MADGQAGITHHEGTHPAPDGCELYWQSWLPESPRGQVLILHGFGEHSGRYQALAGRLVAAGIAVHTFDHRGHGRSGGGRGHIQRWAQFRHDAGRMASELADASLPLFCYGHSMGGLMVLDYALHGEGPAPAGVIASAPFLWPEGVPAWRRALAAVAARLAPTFTESARINASVLSRDPVVVRDYEQDPLVHGEITARLAHEMFGTARRTRAAGAGIRQPLLIVHGEADRLAPAVGSERFFAGVTHPDRTRRTWPDTRHEPHNDLDRDEVITTIRDWVLARITRV